MKSNCVFLRQTAFTTPPPTTGPLPPANSHSWFGRRHFENSLISALLQKAAECCQNLNDTNWRIKSPPVKSPPRSPPHTLLTEEGVCSVCVCVRACSLKTCIFFVLMKMTEKEESVFALHSLDSESLLLLRRRRRSRRREESIRRKRERRGWWRRKTGRKRNRSRSGKGER